ncbi:hypothetical protein ACN28G_20840 [Micromonospora sp. WMMA1923]|uniref:hypothetical protein n=1 Tax=Micromonospora sp. WMMA1923 TaxID=3404125 RepID=UPI003B93EB93
MPQDTIRPDQIAHHQQVLDEARDSLHQILFDRKVSALVAEQVDDPAHLDEFTRSLDDYRCLVEMWERPSRQRFTPHDPGSIRLERIKRSYQQTFDTVGTSVEAAHQRATAGDGGGELPLLAEVRDRLRSIREQEGTLQQARIAAGTVIAHWIRDRVHLTNQVDHFSETEGRSGVTLRFYVRDQLAQLAAPDQEIRYGQWAYLSRYCREANCNEVVALGLTMAHRILYDQERRIGDLLTQKILDVLDPVHRTGRRQHGVLFLGDPDRPESVAVEAWTRTPTVTGAFNYSWEQVHAAASTYQRTALGRDLLTEAEQYLDHEWLRRNAPPADLRNPLANRQDARHYVGAADVYAVDHAYYDRRDDPRFGIALSPGALLMSLNRDPRFSFVPPVPALAAGHPPPTVAQVAGSALSWQPAPTPSGTAAPAGHRGTPSPPAAPQRR